VPLLAVFRDFFVRSEQAGHPSSYGYATIAAAYAGALKPVQQSP